MFLSSNGESLLTALVSSIQFAQRNNALLNPGTVPTDSTGSPGLARVTWFLLLTLLPAASPLEVILKADLTAMHSASQVNCGLLIKENNVG